MSAGNGNVTEESRLESIRRFLGLAGGQRRGDRPQRAESRARSEEESRNIALANWLAEEGGTFLFGILDQRIAESITNANLSITNHAVCATHLGAHAALSRLLADLKALRG